MIQLIKRYRIPLLVMVYIVLFLMLAGEDLETFAALSLFLLSAALFVYITFTQVRSLIRLKREKKETELMHLKSQVNPHFFFNTLNLLYGTVDKDPEKAKELILKLSDLMRYSIYEGQNDYVTVEEEMEYLQQYVALQKARFHKEIDVSFEDSIKMKDLKVMPLLFILLLENAFKHGAENLRKNAYIRMKIRTDQDEVTFNIENNFDPETAPGSGGIGLQNLKRRLELGYKKRHRFSEEVEGGVYRAELTLRTS